MPAGQFVSNLSPGNFGTDGVYIYNAPVQQVTPVGPAVGKLGIVGTGQWGPLNTPSPFTNGASGYALFGPNTTLNNSIMRDALAAMPECNQFVGVRVADGTQAAATMFLTDSISAGTIATLTAQYTGSLPNGLNAAGVVTNPAQASLTYVSSTLTASPVLRLTITFPNQPAEIFNIVAYAVAGSGYNAAAFKANLLAAVNVGSSTQAPSARWTASSGASNSIPNIGTTFTASGGIDGATTITSAVLIGQDGVTGRTGMYALRNAIQGGQFIFAGFFDTTQAATMITFNRGEGTRCGISLPLGTTTASATAIKSANSASDPTLDLCIDWTQFQDPWTGQLVYVAPAAKIEGIISSLDFYQSPSNKPYLGAVGVVGNERYASPVSAAEQAQRQQQGIMYLTNPIPRGNLWGLPYGLASDGVSNVADVRTANYIGLSLMSVLGSFVGEPQSQLANDPVRLAARGAVNQFMNTLLKPILKISQYSNVLDTSNNTPTSIAQGFLVDNLQVQTLAGVRFILVNEQVGTGVQVTVKAA